MSYVATIQQVEAQLRDAKTVADAANRPDEAREFAIALTHLEEAIIRINRGFARREGIFTVSDVQRQQLPEAETM